MGLSRSLAAAAAALVAATATGGPSSAGEAVDVAIVLAVDISRSVSMDEARLQRVGYADALESPQVMSAIRSGFTGRVAVAYLEWASTRDQRVVLDWTVIDGPASAASVADALRSGEPGVGMETSISSALGVAGDLLATLPWPTERRVIDVSGDGANNYGAPLEPIRRRLVDEGVVINGLPIGLAPVRGGDIAGYYETSVIGGPGAFIVSAPTMADFALAVRTKIVLEVAGTPPPVRFAAAE